MGRTKDIGQHPQSGRYNQEHSGGRPNIGGVNFREKRRYKSLLKIERNNYRKDVSKSFTAASNEVAQILKPFPTIDFSSALDIGKKPVFFAKKLTSCVLKINGDVALVLKAAALTRERENKKELYEAIGYQRPDFFHTRLGCMIADMNLYDGLAEKMDSYKEKQKKRVVPVIAAMLQEYVAYGVIPISTVENEFGSEVADLTKELSRITKLPIGLSIPDSDSKLSIYEINKNNSQFVYGRELINATAHPEVVWMIKIVEALQQLRAFSLEKRTTITDKFIETIMHAQGMYRAAAELLGLNQIDKEMQGLILHLLDPRSEKEIQEKYTAWDVEAYRDEFHELLKDAVANICDELGIEKQVKKIKKSVKSPWSAYDKLLFETLKGEMSKIEARYPNLKEDLVQIGCKTLLHEALEKDVIDLEKHSADISAIKKEQRETIVPATMLETVNLSDIYDIVRFRIVVSDEVSPDTCLKLADAIGKRFGENDSRRKNHDKENGYRAVHITCNPLREDFPPLECHFTTAKSEDTNNANHSFFKLEKKGDRNSVGRKSWKPIGFDKLYGIVADIFNRLIINANGDFENELSPNSGARNDDKIYVCRSEDGIIYRLENGAKVEDLLKMIHEDYRSETNINLSSERFIGCVKGVHIEGREVSLTDGGFLEIPLQNADVVSFKHPWLDVPSVPGSRLKIRNYSPRYVYKGPINDLTV